MANKDLNDLSSTPVRTKRPRHDQPTQYISLILS